MTQDTLTTDLSDAHEGALQYLAPGYQDFGGHGRFHGPAKTLLTFEDNTKVRAAVQTAGEGRVLVVDGGGSMEITCNEEWRETLGFQKPCKLR